MSIVHANTQFQLVGSTSCGEVRVKAKTLIYKYGRRTSMQSVTPGLSNTTFDSSIQEGFQKPTKLRQLG